MGNHEPMHISSTAPAEVAAPDGTRLRLYVETGDPAGAPVAPSAGEAGAAGDAGVAGDVVPVVLVHGLGSDARVNWDQAGWLRALRAAGPAGRPLIRYDQRGHGASDAPHDPGRYRLAARVDDLAAVLRAAVPDGGPVDAVGYSLGARVLLEYLAAAEVPVPVRRLVVGGTAGQPLLRWMDPDLVDRAVAGGPIPVDAETARIARTIGALPTNDERALAALVRALHDDPDAQRRAPDPEVPTLVGVGTDDPLHDPAEAWAASLTDGTFLSLAGRNHVSAVPSGVFRTTGARFLG